MKLYNLFNEVILESVNQHRKLLSEGVSDDEVISAIDGMYNVNILYNDGNDAPPSKRYIQVYNLGKTKAGNPAIRAYQIFGGSKTTPKSGAWKIFRLDRIEGWYPTNMKWENPISDKNYSIPTYNQVGDKSMSTISKKVDPSKFGRQRSDITQKPIDNT